MVLMERKSEEKVVEVIRQFLEVLIVESEGRIGGVLKTFHWLVEGRL